MKQISTKQTKWADRRVDLRRSRVNRHHATARVETMKRTLGDRQLAADLMHNLEGLMRDLQDRVWCSPIGFIE